MTRVVLVTGANRGIGQELARQLALRGDDVVLTARDLGKAERAAAALPGRERVLVRRLDVTDPASVEEVAADLDRRYGRLDVLVNNAAVHYDTWQRASTTDLRSSGRRWRSINAFTRMLAGELRRDRILVNAVCPGWVATDMGGPGGRPVAEGAASVLWAVDLPDDGPTGGFYRDGRPVPW
jgi:NAD(P)-dependent dehydrogenase (short-subunit alcohol dehydrogenase family)